MTKLIIPSGYGLVQLLTAGPEWRNAVACEPVALAMKDRDRLEYEFGYPARIVYPKAA